MSGKLYAKSDAAYNLGKNCTESGSQDEQNHLINRDFDEPNFSLKLVRKSSQTFADALRQISQITSRESFTGVRAQK